MNENRVNGTQEVREFIVSDLATTRRFEVVGEPGWRIKSLKQKIAEYEFPVSDGTMTTTGTSFTLKTEKDAIRVVLPTRGRWMKTFTDCFEFFAEQDGVAEFKVIINRPPLREKRQMRENFRN